MKRLLTVLLLCPLTITLTYSQNFQEKLVVAMRESETGEQFNKRLAEFEGITEQQKIESQLIFAKLKIGPKYFRTIVKPAPEKWNRNTAFFFNDPGEYEALDPFMLAMEKRLEKDEAGFKAAIMEAIWLNPSDEASLEMITKFREEKRLANLKIPMDATLLTSSGQKVSLAEYAEGQRAVYVQIWATWCGPCLRLFPKLKQMADDLPSQGIPVLALNYEMNGEIDGGSMEGAAQKKKEYAMNLPWLVETPEEPISSVLGISSVPHAVLLTPDGKVLFKGHPADESLNAALAKLDIEL